MKKLLLFLVIVAMLTLSMTQFVAAQTGCSPGAIELNNGGNHPTSPSRDAFIYINESGEYCFTEDIYVPSKYSSFSFASIGSPHYSSGILISTENITLDLNGYTLYQHEDNYLKANGDFFNSPAGIKVREYHLPYPSNIVIKDGSVQGVLGSSIVVDSIGEALISNMILGDLTMPGPTSAITTRRSSVYIDGGIFQAGSNVPNSAGYLNGDPSISGVITAKSNSRVNMTGVVLESPRIPGIFTNSSVSFNHFHVDESIINSYPVGIFFNSTSNLYVTSSIISDNYGVETGILTFNAYLYLDSSIIEASQKGVSSSWSSINANDVTIEGSQIGIDASRSYLNANGVNIDADQVAINLNELPTRIYGNPGASLTESTLEAPLGVRATNSFANWKYWQYGPGGIYLADNQITAETTAVSIQDLTNATFENNFLEGGSGITSITTDELDIQGNTVVSTAIGGMNIYDAESAKILGNTVDIFGGFQEGIHVEMVDDAQISGNVVESANNAAIGIHVDSSSAVVSDNEINHLVPTATGYYLGEFGIAVLHSPDVLVSDNNLNTLRGIYFSDTQDAVANNNTVDFRETGIHVEDSTNSVVSYNTVDGYLSYTENLDSMGESSFAIIENDNTDAMVEKNVVTDASFGLVSTDSVGSNLEQNTVLLSTQKGIAFENVDALYITGNQIDNSPVGIALNLFNPGSGVTCNDILIGDSIIFASDRGIDIDGSCDGLELFHNDIFESTGTPDPASVGIFIDQATQANVLGSKIKEFFTGLQVINVDGQYSQNEVCIPSGGFAYDTAGSSQFIDYGNYEEEAPCTI